MRFTSRTARRTEVFVVATLIAFAAVTVAAGLALGWDGVRRHLVRLDPALLSGLLALSAVNYLARAERWHLFGRRLGIRISHRRSALYYIAGFALTTTPGKIGEALRLWFMERGHGYRYERTVPLLIADRVGDLNALILLCVFGSTAFLGYFWIVGGVLAVMVATSFLLASSRRARRLILIAYGVVGRWPRLFAGARTAVRRNATLFRPGPLVAATALGGAGWLAECLALYWLVGAFGADLSLRQATFIFSFSMLAGAATMIPGGLGGAEATMIALFLTTGVDAETAFVTTAVIRGTTLWFATALGFCALPVALRAVRAPAPGPVAA